MPLDNPPAASSVYMKVDDPAASAKSPQTSPSSIFQQVGEIVKEAEMLRSLHHPFIIHLEDVFSEEYEEIDDSPDENPAENSGKVAKAKKRVGHFVLCLVLELSAGD